MKLTNKVKDFIKEFILNGDAFDAVEKLGYDWTEKEIFKVLTDVDVENYISDNEQIIKFLHSRSKMSHIAILENLFLKTAKNGKVVDAVRLSEQISTLQKWEEAGQIDTVIQPDLGIREDTFKLEEEEETEKEREEKVLKHLVNGGCEV